MKKGFTLIELLVVVLIIGILSAIALPQYTAAVEKSRATEVLINLRHIKQAYDLQYLADPANISSVKAKDITELSGGKWNTSGTKYCTKRVIYYIDSDSFTASRCKDPSSDCEGCDEPIDYALTFYPSHDTSNVDSCTATSELGYKVCKGTNVNVIDDREG